jgi:hypothetical protein
VNSVGRNHFLTSGEGTSPEPTATVRPPKRTASAFVLKVLIRRLPAASVKSTTHASLVVPLAVGIMKAMPKTPDYFAGKTIVITGAASGIGRAIALIFAREGANVVCADINDKGAGDTAAEVDKKGGTALAIKVDVTKRIEVKEMAERAIATFGRVEFLFNSAGAAIRRAKFLEIDDTLMEKTFALNVMERFTACKPCSHTCSPTGTASLSTWRAWHTAAAAQARRSITRRRRARWYR